VVPSDPDLDLALVRRELAAWTETSLSTPERLRAFTFGASLPRSDMGKSADWPIA
jgi:long-chain acyl-CoA synthetase